MGMTFEFANGQEVANRVGAMIGQISFFAGVVMSREFSDWQTGVMGRKKPSLKKTPWRRHRRSASTLIRPHSRYETERSKKYQQGLRRRLKRRKRPSADAMRLRTSTRPILRETIYQEFVKGIEQSFIETVVWPPKK